MGVWKCGVWGSEPPDPNRRFHSPTPIPPHSHTPMRILLTAFEPFDGTGLNASLEGCRLFLARWAAEFDLRFAVLPVAYGRDVEALERALAEGRADVLLHTGQAAAPRGYPAAIRVERIAVNVRYAGLEEGIPFAERP